MTSKQSRIRRVCELRGITTKLGGRVVYTGSENGKQRLGTVTGARGGYLMIRLDGNKHSYTFHPTWELKCL